MAYISNKLCHFVGRALKDDWERYRLLQKIIKMGMLLVNPNEKGSPPRIGTSSDYKEIDDLGEVFSEIKCICFCDIPDNDLAIHTSKYSKLGLAFRKDFLVQAGARPVQYVPICADMSIQMKGCITPQSPRKYFPEISRLFLYTLIMIDVLNGNDNTIVHMYQQGKQTSQQIKQLAAYLELNLPEIVFENNVHAVAYTLFHHTINSNAYIKLFDPSLPENDPQNYYMEREWRCLENVKFTLDDIETVYLPYSEIMEDLFIKSFPELEDRIQILK